MRVNYPSTKSRSSRQPPLLTQPISSQPDLACRKLMLACAPAVNSPGNFGNACKHPPGLPPNAPWTTTQARREFQNLPPVPPCGRAVHVWKHEHSRTALLPLRRQVPRIVVGFGLQNVACCIANHRILPIQKYHSRRTSTAGRCATFCVALVTLP